MENSAENKDFDVSLVIPTYNESLTIETLIAEVAASFVKTGASIEFVVVDDDSPDGTAQKAESLKNEYDVKVIVRKKERGLATAVVRGFKEASGGLLAVIDGDMQHPPDTITHLYLDMKEHGADMAVASRKVAGGGTKDWEFHRLIISETATLIAKFMLPLSLFKIRDATTGCFMFKRECVDFSKLSPSGFKIFLEVLVKGRFAKKVEIPFLFNQRSLGKSKLTFKQNIIFIYHLIRLGLASGEIAVPAGIAALIAALVFMFF
ncbi:MAG: polyprenol monophosphomannose synthase [Nitrospinota bacterium]